MFPCPVDRAFRPPAPPAERQLREVIFQLATCHGFFFQAAWYAVATYTSRPSSGTDPPSHDATNEPSAGFGHVDGPARIVSCHPGACYLADCGSSTGGIHVWDTNDLTSGPKQTAKVQVTDIRFAKCGKVRQAVRAGWQG